MYPTRTTTTTGTYHPPVTPSRPAPPAPPLADPCPPPTDHPAWAAAAAAPAAPADHPAWAAVRGASGHPAREASAAPARSAHPADSDPLAARRAARAGASGAGSDPARGAGPLAADSPWPPRPADPAPVAVGHAAWAAVPVAEAHADRRADAVREGAEPVVPGRAARATALAAEPHPTRGDDPRLVAAEPYPARGDAVGHPVWAADAEPVGPGAEYELVAVGGPALESDPAAWAAASAAESHPADVVAMLRPARAADPGPEPMGAHPGGPDPVAPVPRAASPADPGPGAPPARSAHPADPVPPPPAREPHPADPAREARVGRWVDAGRGAARGDVPAARAEAEVEADAPQGTGVPGPGVAEIVARAVARGMDADAREEGDTQDLPHLRPARGAAVTEVPVHLPFRPARPAPAPPRPQPPARRAPAARPPAGRRVPRGDDRLREHRGPVLPGWIAVAVGGLAVTGCAAVLWRAGAVPAPLVAAFGAAPRSYQGLRAAHWPPLAFLGVVALLALGGLGRAKAGHAWVLTLFGRYRGTVRRTGLTWISPLLLRQRVDVRLRHWRSEPMPAVDSGGLALQVVVQVVWQVKDTARATLAVEDHTDYLAEQVESAMARVLSQLPADAFHEDAPTLRDAEAVGDALTRMLAAETEAVGIEVFSAQPTRIEYAPEVAEAMRRRRVAAIDAKHRDTVLTSVVDAVDDTVHRLTSRGIVELDDYERKALVKDLTVAFYTGRSDQ